MQTLICFYFVRINRKDPNLLLVIALTQEVNGKGNKTEYSFHRSFRLVKEQKLIRTREKYQITQLIFILFLIRLLLLDFNPFTYMITIKSIISTETTQKVYRVPEVSIHDNRDKYSVFNAEIKKSLNRKLKYFWWELLTEKHSFLFPQMILILCRRQNQTFSTIFLKTSIIPIRTVHRT